MATFTAEQRELYNFAVARWVFRKDRSFATNDYIQERTEKANKPVHVAKRTLASFMRRGMLKHPIINGVVDETRYTVSDGIVAIEMRRLEQDERAYRRMLKMNGEGTPIN